MIKAGHTRRKFYGKWLYKVTIQTSGVSIFRLLGVLGVLEFCNTDRHPEKYSYATKDKAYENRNAIRNIAELLSGWQSDQWTKRIESDILDIYTNNQEYYNEACEKLTDILRRRFEPAPNALKDLDTATNIVVKRYPHNLYKHKVYLLPHKMVADTNVRKEYLQWVEAQSPRILITDAVKRWFTTTTWNWDRRYVLVDSEQSLLMLKLRNSEVMGRVYNYVLADK